MGKIIGIDLGTTNSAIAVMMGGDATIIPSPEGHRTVPSVVAQKGDETLVGAPAKRQAVQNPQGTIFSAKRFIGHTIDEVEEEAKRMPFAVKPGKDHPGCLIEFHGEDVRPEVISAKVLASLKASAEAFLGEPVTEAVITVPAYFNDSQRQSTKDAGAIAGLEVKRIINEPTAAALAYGLDKTDKDQKIAVYDLGGGTFDISLLELGDGVFEVLSTNGDTHLGGDNFDEVIIDHILSSFKKEEGVDLSQQKDALQRIKEAAEKAKIELSSTASTEINLPFITADSSGPKHLVMTMTKAQLESLVIPLIERSLEPVQKALSDASLSTGDIDEVILVGGMTRMPAVQEAVEKFFGKPPHKGINPDEVVAMGAAIQGGILMGDVRDVVLLDVTPLSLGLETLGGISTKLIERNTTIPTSKSQVFSTAADNQPQVEVHVVQGEREMATDNKSLGRFILDGIPPAPRGTPQIEVTFDLDANGILKVSALDKGSGKKQHITIEGSSGLTDEEIEKMKADAEANAAADKAKKEAIEARNNLDGAIFQGEKLLTDAEGKISEDLKSDTQQAIDQAKESLMKEDATKEDYETAFKELMEKMQKAGSALYEAQESEENSSSEQADSSASDTVEAEVVDTPENDTQEPKTPDDSDSAKK